VLQRLLGALHPHWWLRHGGRVVVRGAAGRIRHSPGHHLFSSNLRLGEFAEWDLLRTAQVGEVRVVLAPAAELVGLLADADIPLPPPRFGIAIGHTVADRPGDGDLTGQAFVASLPQSVRARMSRSFSVAFITFLQAKRSPRMAGWIAEICSR